MKKNISVLMAAAAFVVGCDSIPGASSEESSSDSSSSAEPTTQVDSLNLTDLNLSASMSPDVPSSLSSDSSALHLAGAKSFELCEMKRMIDEVKMNIDMAASMSCQIQSAPGVEWGGKYFIDLGGMMGGEGMPSGGGETPPGGDEFAMPLTEETGIPSKIHFYLDNSDANAYKIWICDEDSSGNKTLTQKFVVSSAAKGKGAKGSYTIKMNMGSGNDSMEMAGSFDNGISDEGRYRGDVQMRFAMSNMKIGSYIKMDLGKNDGDTHYIDSGFESAVSFDDLSSSEKSLLSGSMGPNHGMAVMQHSGGSNSMFDGASTGPQTSKTFFDSTGLIVAADASTEFAEGGKLHVGPDRFVKLPDDSFSVSFGADAWDCSGSSEIDMSAVTATNEAGESCMDSMSQTPSSIDCWGADYGPGAEQEGVQDYTDERFDETFEPGDFEPITEPVE